MANATLVRRLFMYLGGMALLTLGVALLIHSTLGADPWDSLTYGLSLRFGLTVGLWTMAVGVLMVLLAAWINRSWPNAFALFAGFLAGACIDGWFWALVDALPHDALWQKGLYFAGGIATVGLGTALYVLPRFPPSPIDLFMVTLGDRFRLTLGQAKWLTDLVGLGFCLMLGAPLTWGTLLLVVGIGAVVGWMEKGLKRSPFFSG